MAEYRRHEIVTGLFILVAVAAFSLFAFKVGRYDFFDALQGPRLRCVTYLDDVKTLTSGAKVTAAGRVVGSVSELRLVERAIEESEVSHLATLGGRPDLRPGLVRQIVEVSFELTDPALLLDPKSARVTLLQDGFLGQHFLDLEPGFWEKGAAPKPLFEAGHADGFVVAARAGTDVEKLLSAVYVSVTDVHEILEKVNHDVLSPANSKALSKLIDDLGAMTGEARSFLEKERPDGLHRSIVEPLQATIRGADRLVADLRTSLVDGAIPKAEKLLESSQTSLDALSGDARGLVGDARGLLGHVDELVTENSADVAESMRRLRRSLWEAEMALRKVRSDPSVVLFGDDEQDLEAVETDESGTRKGGRARPYGQRDESPDGKR